MTRELALEVSAGNPIIFYVLDARHRWKLAPTLDGRASSSSEEPALIMFVVEGGLIYLDKPANGSVAAYEDGLRLSS